MSWSNGVWNQVFSGVEGAPDDATFPNPPYTTLDETPVSREKPYLFVDDEGRYAVRVPAAQIGTRGISWAVGAVPLKVADAPGIVVAGVTIDAGTVESPVLLQVGKPGAGQASKVDAANPITLSDVYLRVGGPHIGKADTATGLFVEHFQQFDTVWNGERGTTVLYQNELPYDPPTQADWTRPDGTLGYAGYKVGDGVTEHTLYGGGVYVFNQNNPLIITANGFEVPEAPGVVLHHIMTVNLGAGTIQHVVNGVGGQADTTKIGVPQYLVQYPLL